MLLWFGLQIRSVSICVSFISSERRIRGCHWRPRQRGVQEFIVQFAAIHESAFGNASVAIFGDQMGAVQLSCLKLAERIRSERAHFRQHRNARWVVRVVGVNRSRGVLPVTGIQSTANLGATVQSISRFSSSRISRFAFHFELIGLTIVVIDAELRSGVWCRKRSN
jgi:hypothetical protein